MSELLTSPSFEHPSLFRRLAAILYDSMLLIAVSMAYGLAYLGIAKLFFQLNVDRPDGLLYQLGWLVSILGFFCFFWMRGGQTTGMRAWKIKIINSQQKTPCLSECLLRLLLAPIGWLLFFTAFFNQQKLCLHDRYSGTQLIVIDRKE